MSIYGPSDEYEFPGDTSQPARDISMRDKKLVDLGDPVDDSDAVPKHYVDWKLTQAMNWRFVSVCASKKGALTNGKFEWSFGGGNLRHNPRCGYTMLGRGRICRMGLSGGYRSSTTVRVAINSTPIDALTINKPKNIGSVWKEFDTESHVIAPGDVVSLVSVVPADDPNDADFTVVSLLISIVGKFF